MISFYKPNSKNTGTACSFSVNSKDNSVWGSLIKQSSWNDAKKIGSFSENQNNPNKSVTDLPIETKCASSGCVLPKCVKDGKPSLIFVDTAISASFINDITDIKDDRIRPFEILELKKLIRIEIPTGHTYDL